MPDTMQTTEMIQLLRSTNPDTMATMEFPIRYGRAVLNVENAIREVCFKLDLEVLDWQRIGGLLRSTLYIKVDGRCGDLLRLAEWLEELVH